MLTLGVYIWFVTAHIYILALMEKQGYSVFYFYVHVSSGTSNVPFYDNLTSCSVRTIENAGNVRLSGHYLPETYRFCCQITRLC